MVRWALISAERGYAATECALEAVGALRAAGLRVGGYHQHKWRNERGEKRYDLVHLSSGERVVLAVDGVAPKGPGEELFCSMSMHESGFESARRWVAADAADSDVLLLDGISKLEISGKGHAATLESVLVEGGPVLLLCTRASQLSGVLERFALPDDGLVAALELPASIEDTQSFQRELVAGIGRRGIAAQAG